MWSFLDSPTRKSRIANQCDANQQNRLQACEFANASLIRTHPYCKVTKWKIGNAKERERLEPLGLPGSGPGPLGQNHRAPGRDRWTGTAGSGPLGVDRDRWAWTGPAGPGPPGAGRDRRPGTARRGPGPLFLSRDSGKTIVMVSFLLVTFWFSFCSPGSPATSSGMSTASQAPSPHGVRTLGVGPTLGAWDRRRV